MDAPTRRTRSNGTQGGPAESLPALPDSLFLVSQWIRRRLLQEEVSAASGVPLERSATTILAILDHDGPRRAADLIDMIGLDQSTLSRRLASLERAGLIARRSDPSDGRAALISVTRAGRAALERARRAVLAQYQEILRDWDPRDVAQLSDLLSALAASIRSYVERATPGEPASAEPEATPRRPRPARRRPRRTPPRP